MGLNCSTKLRPSESSSNNIREYYVGEPDGTPIATIEVSRCREVGHL